MRTIALAIVVLLCALLIGACGSFATSAPPAPAAAPTATYDPFGTNGCKTCDPQQRRLQATSTGQ